MQTEIDKPLLQDALPYQHALPYTKTLRPGMRTLDLILLFILSLCALLPRILLARQLDVVTDENVYILAGKIDFHLLAHLNFHDSAWNYNYEHPALVKLLIGLALYLNAKCFHLFPELFAARLPSILSGTLLVLAVYALGKAPFRRSIAFPAALCLAFSPWLCYFSALAYLDTTMTLLVSLPFLLLWYTPRRPWLYPLIFSCLALAAASKYTALLAIPAILLFMLCSSLIQIHSLSLAKYASLPWLPWAVSCPLFPLVFLAADPSIWRNPLSLLKESLFYQFEHSSNGHLTFFAGQAALHAPFWTIFIIIFSKLSLFVTLPAAAFILFVLAGLLFRSPLLKLDSLLLFCWLLGILIPFSQLSIVVGTHYELPVAAPLALAAAYALRTLFHALADIYSLYFPRKVSSTIQDTHTSLFRDYKKMNMVLSVSLLCLALAGPHLNGLLTNYAAEGYTSELFQGENSVIQVAYPAYREGALWIAEHSHTVARVGLVALVNTLNHGAQGVSWYDYNSSLPTRLNFSEAHPDASSFAGYDYLIWPMHLVQRGYHLPSAQSMHIVHTITGGQTLYCYILARSTVSISQ
jgi:4-amino-4-deoxy-L-arabinose transferase-like glycosyltransferase